MTQDNDGNPASRPLAAQQVFGPQAASYAATKGLTRDVI